ncbi:MAG TPA: ABC transporter permease, partial [Fimbriimonas sp.]|nr:ABC transporter permease [Fimbriimonas sp.]
RGWFYEYRDETQLPLQSIARILRTHVEKLAKLEGIDPPRLLMVDAVNNGDNRTWKNNVPGRFALDCEPMVLAGMNALTFRTIDDGRDRFDTPFDTLDHVDISNVFRQIQTTTVLFHHLLDDRQDQSGTDENRVPLDDAKPTRTRLIGGFGLVRGQVVSYDPQKSFIPDTKQPNSLACAVSKQKTLMGVRGDLIQYAEGPNANYALDGLALSNSWANPTDVHAVQLQAFHIDQATGNIDMAPTWELPGFEAYDTIFPLTTTERESPIVVFKSVSVDLYDMVDPQALTALTFTMLFDPATGSRPRNFGIFEPPFDQRLSPEVEDAQVIFLLPGQRFQVLSGAIGDSDRLILTNSTLTDEKGSGYEAPGGSNATGRADAAMSGVFSSLPLQTAIDLTNINDGRLNQFRKYRIISGDVEDLEKQAHQEIDAAQKAIQEKNWTELERHSRAAWGFALRAHPIVMSTANDVVNGVVFYLFLLIPFSYFLERLLFGNRLLTKQLSWTIVFFIASFLLLRLIHPAFEIVTNPSMIFIAFVMGALSIIVIGFIVGKFESSMQEIKAQQSGMHEVDIRRSSVAMAAFNLGVSNMRRRKARTILTTLTLVVMTFIVLSFTSMVNKLQLDQTPTNNVARYSGIMIRNPGMDQLQLATYRQIQNEFTSATVVRRAYYYGADVGTEGILSLQRGKNVIATRAMLGLDPDEDQVLKPQTALYAGRWFKPGERKVMILPQDLAEEMKIDPSQVGKAKVTYAGIDFTVIGLANSSVLRSLRDLDGDGVMPPDFSLSREFQTKSSSTNKAFRSFVRIDPGAIFILPAETALQLGADLRTLAVKFTQPDATQKALESLMPRLRLNLYAGVPVTPGSPNLVVREFSVQQGSESSGLLMILVQLVIAGVFVLNTMIASVYERTREIAIFSSIGLAPNHISMLFFAESLVYGILGAVIGYFAAQITAKIIVATGTLQGLTLNFSSSSAVMSAGLVMAVVIGSTIYPARKAAKIAAPAMNEEVFQTEPDGDVWDLPLPFSISASEAGPIAHFLRDWVQAHEGYTIGSFVSAETELEAREGGVFVLRAVTWLAPFDLGVSQRLELTLSPSVVAGVYMLDLRLTRLGGDPENWPTVNQRFLASIRKEFLTWRTLGAEVREKYLAA